MNCGRIKNVPRFQKVVKKAHCPFCQDGEHLTKNDEAVYLAVNSGPTGGVFVCVKHAEQLAKELSALLAPKHLERAKFFSNAKRLSEIGNDSPLTAAEKEMLMPDDPWK